MLENAEILKHVVMYGAIIVAGLWVGNSLRKL